MSLFHRTPNAATLEYESWSPAATAERAAAIADGDGSVEPTGRPSGRSRTGPQHLESAVRALDAAAARRSW